MTIVPRADMRARLHFGTGCAITDAIPMPTPVQPSLSEAVPCIYANLADLDVAAGVATTHTIAGVTRPARRLIVGSIGAAGVTLTLLDGSTTVIMSQAQLIACGGVVERQFVKVQSANSTDLSVDY